MRVSLYGTRGSLPTPGPATSRFGGNTSCVRVDGAGGSVLVLDAGTGIRSLGMELPPGLRRVDVLLTHLHLDHIQGLGFFAPLYDPGMEVHIWGPTTQSATLVARLSRYLSPPLFPVALADLPCRLITHNLPCGSVDVGEFRFEAQSVCHPGPTLGFRIEEQGKVLTYIPDHEPALGARVFPESREWTSGYELAEGADLLVHDAQYTTDEYAMHIGWGHSSISHTLEFARLVGCRHLIPFHHDPSRDDASLVQVIDAATRELRPSFLVTPGAEGESFQL
jgi:phosphoribosyl 1,2-cyclic phosphodiesterase